MGAPAGFRVECLKAVLQSGADNYKENTRVSTLLDDKAQKTGGMAGIFLAATFGFLSPDKIHALALKLNLEFPILILFTVGVFIACVGACLAVMWVRAAAMPVALESVNQMAQDLLLEREASADPEISELFYHEQIGLWRKILDSQQRGNKLKARLLLWSQGLLGCGMLLVAGILIAIVVSEILYVPAL
jgi:hypothetical protein